MKRLLTPVAVGILVALLAACGSDGSDSPPAQPEASEEVTQAEMELVGTWKRVTTCSEVVELFGEAGLEKWIPEMVAGNSFVPGVKKPTQLKDGSDPCKASVSREHSHFFTEDGNFGSLDWHGNQVDDGTYELTGADTFAVSKEFPEPVTFHFSIDGDTMMLDPVVPNCSPDCFEAAWSVIVAYAGEKWHRVD